MSDDPSGVLERPQLVVFDCDGVLIDTERLAVPIDVELLGELGWTISEEEVVERFVGLSEADAVKVIEGHLGRPIPHDLSFESERRYRQAFEKYLEPVPGVIGVLDKLDAGGVATCVASSGSHEKMRFTLGLTGLYDRFEGRIFSVQEVSAGKPAPDLFLHAAKAMGMEPSRCVVVEDSPFGVEGALAAGMRPFGYAGGLMPRERLEVEGCVVFEDMALLPALLGLD